ncbi:MAG: hypothetical protein HYW48_04115 [Deltaproteobacteria bacterium]|nr:hypothetical protein [Deltaproteobacteria bacterium]
MRPLTKNEAEKIAEVTSGIYEQGNMWVFREFDLDTGIQRLTRGLTLRMAKKRLRTWRRERIEQLLRGDGNSSAFALRVFQTNPSWKGEGVWSWLSNQWFTSKKEAEEALEKKKKELSSPCEVIELKTGELPGHFSIA